MDRKTFYIGILSVSATLLVMANYFAPQPALAMLTIKDRDFSWSPLNSQAGGDALYVAGQSLGPSRHLAYDPSSRALRPRFTSDMTAVFAQGDDNEMIRHDWNRCEIQAVYDTPLMELVYQAATVHRQFHDAVAKSRSAN